MTVALNRSYILTPLSIAILATLPGCEGIEIVDPPAPPAEGRKAEVGDVVETHQQALVTDEDGNFGYHPSFEIGPGTGQHHSHYRTLSVPAHTLLGVGVEIDTQVPVPLVVEVHQASATSVGTSGPDGPLLKDMIVTHGGLTTFENTGFHSEFGCPSTWRVRVRTLDNQPPPARIAGRIVYVGTLPKANKLDLTGDVLDIVDHTEVARAVKGIDNTGTVRVKAKWHTEPLDLVHFGSYQRLTVFLVRPDGTVAASENGFSQHAPADKTPKINFGYRVTAADRALSGNWTLRVRNSTSVDVVDFDIERGWDLNSPSFTSTLTPHCD